MKHFRRQFTEAREKGQSLVEVALFFPIFLVILAGVVEVSHLVITQNRVSNAARSSTRFAANGGEDAGMVNVTLNTVTQTLEVSDDVWDIWSIRGTLNDAGTDFADWTFTHIYGITNTTRAPDIDEAALRQQVIDELQVDHQGDTSAAIAGGLRIVGTYAIHDVESILGLDTIPDLVGFSSISALSVMRVTGLNLEQTNGCDGFPIAVHEGARSVSGPPGVGANPYPNADDFSYPDAPPLYEDFRRHIPDIPLFSNDPTSPRPREGTLYKVQNGSGSGNFGWLVWNTGVNASAPTLGDSLAWPGNALDYVDHGDGGQVLPGFNHVVRGYVEPDDPTDTDLNVGDVVAGSTGAINAAEVRSTMELNIRLERELRLMVWNSATGTGSNARYTISGFAIFRPIGYSLDQGQGGSWILAEFIRWDNSCGQVSATP